MSIARARVRPSTARRLLVRLLHRHQQCLPSATATMAACALAVYFGHDH